MVCAIPAPDRVDPHALPQATPRHHQGNTRAGRCSGLTGGARRLAVDCSFKSEATPCQAWMAMALLRREGLSSSLAHCQEISHRKSNHQACLFLLLHLRNTERFGFDPARSDAALRIIMNHALVAVGPPVTFGRSSERTRETYQALGRSVSESESEVLHRSSRGVWPSHEFVFDISYRGFTTTQGAECSSMSYLVDAGPWPWWHGTSWGGLRQATPSDADRHLRGRSSNAQHGSPASRLTRLCGLSNRLILRSRPRLLLREVPVHRDFCTRFYQCPPLGRRSPPASCPCSAAHSLLPRTRAWAIPGAVGVGGRGEGPGGPSRPNTR